MRLVSCALIVIFAATPSQADPSCETLYWSRVLADEGGLPWLDGPILVEDVDEPLPAPGEMIALLGRDLSDPETEELCPDRFRILRQPVLVGYRNDGWIEPLPLDYGANSNAYDWLALHDPDQVLYWDSYAVRMGEERDLKSAAVTLMIDLDQGILPVAYVPEGSFTELSNGYYGIVPFDQIDGHLGWGGGLLIVTQLPDAPALTHVMRWRVH